MSLNRKLWFPNVKQLKSVEKVLHSVIHALNVWCLVVFIFFSPLLYGSQVEQKNSKVNVHSVEIAFRQCDVVIKMLFASWVVLLVKAVKR